MHSPNTLHYEEFDGVPVHRLQYWWPVTAQRLRRQGGGIPINVRGSSLAKLQLLSLGIIYALQIVRLVRQYDLIHAQFTLAAGAAVLGSSIHRRPVVATIHGSDIFQAASAPIGGLYTRWTLKNCRKVVAVSSVLRQSAIELGIPSSHCVVIPNSVDTDYFFVPADQLQGREQIILFVGSLIKRKGVDILLKALVKTLRIAPEALCVIAGEGPEQGHLESLAHELGISERIQFLGMIDRTHVRIWMQRAKVLVLPSTEEGQGVVMLEAMACGTPVIGTSVGGIPEVLTSEVGWLVPPTDVDALNAALLDALTHTSAWSIKSVRSRNLVETQFSAAAVYRQYDVVYQDALRDSGHR